MIKNILWDFDGVILDSMVVRDTGFEEIFKDYPEEKINELLKFHRINGGLSRYVKIRHFYETVLEQPITDQKVLEYANSFSRIMLSKLADSSLLIKQSTNFIKSNFKNYNFHIVSGSDNDELNVLSRQLDIADYFISIHGSPTPKKELVRNLMGVHNYDKEKTCLIGDSINDYEAASDAGISFLAFNNDSLDRYTNLSILDDRLKSLVYK